MANFNKVLLMGNLTRDPELRYAGQSNAAICSFGLAVNRRWRTQSGEEQEETCFVDVVTFGRQAETVNEYLVKGRPVFIEGRLQLDQWEDRETGAKRSKLKVVAERVQFLGGRDDGQGGGQQSSGNRGGGQRSSNRGGGGQQRDDSWDGRDAPSGQHDGGNQYDFDDIPF